MRKVYLAVVAVVSTLFPAVFTGPAFAQTLSITNYQTVSSARVTLTQWNYTFTADLVNPGPLLASASATVTTSVPNIVVVAGQDTLNFGVVPANSHVTSKNTFTVTVDRSVYFDFADLHWTFNSTAASNPVANAGNNQTVALGSTANLNGAASTNPSGYGVLTYSWAFTSRPATSNATLLNPTSVFPSFVVDVAGSYVIKLTVSNGFGSSSASVTVSTNNSPPVAVAGPNQTVNVGSKVTLDGSKSYDVDGDPITYAWTMMSVPSGSQAALTGASTVSPTFVADKAGSYTVQLVVNDGKVNSAPSTVTITTQNTPPVANAGVSQLVSIGALVHLDGSGSTDVDGDPLTYQWSLTTVPANSSATLSNPTSVKPTFTADRPGTYVAQLVVNDGFSNSTPSTVTITTNAPLAPTANPGQNQTVKHNSTVTLSGGGTDPQGWALTYLWSLTTVPSGSTAVLSSTTAQGPTFYADKPGTYVAQLIVNDGYLSSTPATVTITTTNTAPVANAGPAQNVPSGTTVTLDGSGSSDADHDSLTYSWTLSSKPTGSTAVLNGATTVAPTFTADLAGTYVVQLIVSDPYSSSTPVTVTITATSTIITLTPNPLNLYNTPANLTVTIGALAGPGGQTVTFSTTDASIASVPASVVIAQGLNSTTVPVTPGNVGSVTITAYSTGFTSATTTVNVATPVVTLTLDSANLGFTKSMNGLITLSAPASTYPVTVALSSNPSGIVTLPASVTVSPGNSTASFTVQSVALGTTTIVASSPGYITGTANVTVGMLGAIKLPVNASVGPNQTVNYAVALAALAPSGGVTVTLNSTDTNSSIVKLSTTSVFIPAGSTTPTTVPTITGVNFGSATITASAPGFTGDSQQVQVTGSLSLQPTSVVIPVNGTQNLTLTLSSPAPAGLTINLSSGDSTIASVPSSIAFPANTTTLSIPVTGVGVGGPVLIHANSLPNLAEVTSSVSVVSLGAISVTNVTTSQGSSVAFPVSIPISAPAGGVTVSLVSGDISKVTVSPSSVTIPAGSKTPAVQPQVTGVAVGSANVTASAPGFTSAAGTVTVTVGTPQSVTATAGTPQSATVNTAFAAALSATVKDGSGNPLGGITVTFTAPASGASGTFANGTATTSSTTNSLGVAVSTTFTANGTAGIYTVSASVSGVSTPASFSMTNISGTPASIATSAGTPQSAVVNTAFATALSAIVKDSLGNPVSGATVTFTAPSSGASGTFSSTGTATATGVTNTAGIATSSTFTANGSIGSYAVQASVAPIQTTASFNLTNLAGPPASLSATSGTPQSVAVNTAFASVLSATVKDSGGNLLSGITVTFTAPSSGASGTFANGTATTTAVTNAQGVAASSIFTANGTLGTYNVVASVTTPALTANFALTNIKGPASSITATGGATQSTGIGTAFASVLSATVKDSGGNLLSGITVTFTAPSTGASGTFANGTGTTTAVTDASGVAASSVFTANTTKGSYTVIASVAGLTPTASFALTNSQGGPSSISATSGTPQSVAVNTAFPAALSATVKDLGGNVLSGITVTFTAPASAASGTFANSTVTTTAITDANGVATASTFTSNGTLGSYTVIASVAGLTPTASFALTNVTGPPSAIAATGGTPQTAAISTAFASVLSATVKDSGGNVLSGITVTFTAPSTGASGTFANGTATTTAVTNASGVAASSVFTANTTKGGPYNVVASVAGLTPTASFALTNAAGLPASFTATSGTPQSVAVNTAFATALSATVKDIGGNPLSGITVTFTAPASGASGTFANSTAIATAITDANGLATASTFTANGTLGTYTVVASISNPQLTTSFALTNIAGPPATVTATGGTGQSAGVNTPFANVLSATVKDSGGNLLSGVSVTFTAPGSGASGTFANGTATTTATTNASGVAVSSTFTANGTLGSYAVTATVGALTPASFTLTNVQGLPSSITPTGGTAQTAAVNTAFATLLSATVKDSGGNLLSGVQVTFTAPTSSASGTFANGTNTTIASTNSSGVATASVFTANGTIGTYLVTAQAAGLAATASFNLANVQGPPSTITATGGASQTATVVTAYATVLSATVKDSGGNALSGVTVTFTAPASGASGTFANGTNTTTAATNSAGVASSTIFTANSTAGGFNIVASVSSLSASFSLTNLAGSPASVAVSSGTSQSASINTAFGAPLAAVVKDAYSNLVSGATVTFTAPASGPSGLFANSTITTTANTNASGIATSSTFTANSTASPGLVAYNVLATVAGVSTPASFSLINKAGAPASITATSGTPQSAQINTAFGAPLTVVVKDAGTNPVSGLTVTFTPQTCAASVTFAGGVQTAVTDANGTAVSAIVTANSTAGQCTVAATAAGLTNAQANFVLTINPGPAKVITASSGTPQSAVVNTAFASPLAVQVLDAGNNAVSGVTVTFAVPGSGASGTFGSGANTAISNSSGIATSQVFTANTTAGTYSVIASVSGVSGTVPFLLNNTAGPAASITATSGSGQSAAEQSTFANPFTATVKDSYGNLVSGASVVFTAPSSGPSGTFAGATTYTVPTNASGIATSAAFTANKILGAYSVTASVAGVATGASFALTNLIGSPAIISAISGTPQSTLISTAFASPLVASVTDSGGNGLVGVLVTFTCPASAATCVFPSGNTALTNSQGIATSSSVAANGVAGSYTVTATAPGLASSASFALTNTSVTNVGTITVGNASVGFNLQAAVVLSLSAAAPTGGLQVTLTSSDSTKLLLAGRQGDAGAASVTVGVAEGSTLTTFFAQSLASSGTATVTATALAYGAGTGTITLTPSGFVLAGPSGLGVTSLSTGASGTVSLSVYSAQLDSGLNFAQLQLLRPGITVNVPLNSSNTSAGTVTPTVSFTNAGSNPQPATFTPLSAGTTTVSVGVPSAPAGFSLPAQDTNLVITVTPMGMSITQTDASIGKFLQTDAQIQLSSGAPGPTPVTITSSDASKLLLSNSATGAGSASITVNINTGYSFSPSFYVQSLASSGTAQYTATSSYGTVTKTVTLVPSGVILAGPFGIGAASFFTSTGGATSTITVYTAQLDSGLNFAGLQSLAGGQSVSATVTSSNTAVGQIITPTVSITSGNNSNTTQFLPLSAGSSTISVSTPAGWSTPTADASVLATVTTPSISIDDGVTIGQDLEYMGTALIGQTAPAGGIPIKLTSSDPTRLLLAANATDAGAASITVTIPAGSNSVNYYLQSLSSSGAPTYTASSSGFANRNATVTMAPSGVVLSGPFGIYLSFFFASVSSGAQTHLSVQTAQLDPSSLAYAQTQQLRGGLTVSVPVQSSSTSTGTVSPTPATITGGSGTADVYFQPVSPGNTTITITKPSNFGLASTNTSLAGTVTP